ncbi:MAG: hypothetical protein ABSH34_22930, partial [Verrucomicrobiota bacterium]
VKSEFFHAGAPGARGISSGGAACPKNAAFRGQAERRVPCLTDWAWLAQFSSTSATMPFIDLGARNYGRRFYRGQWW